MFEQIFIEALNKLTEDLSLIDSFHNEVILAHGSEGRHYHNLSHLDHLITVLLPVKNMIEDQDTMIFTIAYHDIIYNPLRDDNEAESGKLAYQRLSALNCTEVQKQKCVSQILATTQHLTNGDSDADYFTDADLAILGARQDDYLHYTQKIRKEYVVFPDEIYKPGRQNVLTHFLQMEQIYKTSYFFNKYEERARLNLSQELRELTN